MCGIFGYVGMRKNATQTVFAGLKLLEYRGYDSWGIAFKKGAHLQVYKRVGRIPSIFPDSTQSSSIAVGHCLAQDTLVQLSNGSIKPIGEITSGEKVGTVDFNKLLFKNTQSVVAWKHKAPKELYTIKTPFSSFKATENHQLFVALPSGDIVTKRVKDLSGEELLPIIQKVTLSTGKPFHLQPVATERHFIPTSKARHVLRTAREKLFLTRKALEKKSGVKERYIANLETGIRQSTEAERLNKLLQALSLPLDYRLFLPSHFKTNDVVLPTKTSSFLLQVLGYHLGDGHCGERFLRYKDTSQDIVKRYVKLYKKIFNLNTTVEKKKNYFIFTFNSKFLVEWYKKNFSELLCRTGKKDIPSFIGTLPSSQIAYFLKGIFDAEATVATHARQIKLCIVDKTVTLKLQLLLLRFGIISTYSSSDRSSRGWQNVHMLLISDKNSLILFKRVINFSSYTKREKLDSILSSIGNKNFQYLKVPIRKDFFASEAKTLGIKMQRNSSYYNTESLKKIMALAKYKNPVFYQRLQLYLDSDVVWSRFKKQQVPCTDQFVYDLEVPYVSNFIGNGVIQHNSRWATHGGVTEANAHPHLDCTKQIALLHNGIIENFAELKNELLKKGHKFISETDTEVASHLIEENLKKHSFEDAVRLTFNSLHGMNAIVVLNTQSSEIIAAKNGSPLVVGIGNNEYFIASDVSGIVNHTRKVIFLKDNEMVKVGDNLILYSLTNGAKIKPNIETVDWKIEQATKGRYAYFMLKEIEEQPMVIRNIVKNYDEQIKELARVIKKAHGTFFIAAGTAYHACLGGVYLFSKVAHRHVNTALASEFNYLLDFLNNKSLVIALSQSGETIDVIEPLHHAQQKGARIIGITNTLGSTIYRMSDLKLLLGAGPEKAVASTKAYIAKLAVFLLLAYELNTGLKEIKPNMLRAAQEIDEMIQQSFLHKLKKLAKKLSKKEHLYTLGRGASYTSALEAALKIKEVSYLHTEGLAGGELKHGTIALIEKETPVIVFAPLDETYTAMISNATEVKARGGMIIGVSPKNNSIFDEWIKVNDLGDATLMTQVIPAQLLAYYLALEKGYDPDKPRNLAKSVTVK